MIHDPRFSEDGRFRFQPRNPFTRGTPRWWVCLVGNSDQVCAHDTLPCLMARAASGEFDHLITPSTSLIHSTPTEGFWPMNIAEALATAESYIDEETGEPNLYHVDRDPESVAGTIEALLTLHELVLAADVLAACSPESGALSAYLALRNS